MTEQLSLPGFSENSPKPNPEPTPEGNDKPLTAPQYLEKLLESHLSATEVHQNTIGEEPEGAPIDDDPPPPTKDIETENREQKEKKFEKYQASRPDLY